MSVHGARDPDSDEVPKAKIAEMYAVMGNNNRPVMQTNRRRVVVNP